MSETTTWAVLSDGRYIKVMIHNGTDTSLHVLDADKNPDLAEICYQVVNSKPEFSAKGSVKAKKMDFIQLQADFLAKQYEQGLYQQLIIAAPGDVIKSLRAALPANLNELVVGELAEDLMIKSNDLIDAALADIIPKA
jgi:protein required for attachment to host cells